MEILIELLKTIGTLSGPAVWLGLAAVIGLFTYKTLIVGSIYGVMKFAIQKMHDVLTKPIHERKTVDITADLDGMMISGCTDYLIRQIKRIKNKRTGISTNYIHEGDVDWLREAIDEKMEREALEDSGE